MKVDMLMPQMGESITEATISRWLKQAGEYVERDEIILEITTDKVDSEIPAPASGILSDVGFAEGEVVPVKTKIAVIDTNAQAAEASEVNVVEAEVIETSEQVTPTQEETVEPVQPEEIKTQTSSESDRFYSPLVRSLAEQHAVNLSDLDSIPGSGKNGRFTKEDFLAYVNQGKSVAENTSTNLVAQSTATKESSPQIQKSKITTEEQLPINQWLENGTKIVPMDNMRKAIAEHMVRSKHTSPHVYSIQEVDVTNVSKWRKAQKAEFKNREGFNLSFTPFFLEAAVKAIQEFPIVNSSVEGQKVIYKKDINLGCAVALGNTGLIVPVIKKADQLNLVGLARSLNDLALRARDKKLMPDEVMDGTFTITNPGIFGTMIGTPIINQPQVAILCLGAIEKRPVVVDDMIAVRERCYLTLSYDHRIIDGAVGAQFLAHTCNYLENWDTSKDLF